MQLDVKIFEAAMLTKSSEAINKAANDIINQLELELILTDGYEQLIYDYLSLHACAYGRPGHSMKNKSMSENARSTYDQIKKQIENVTDFQKANDLMQAIYGCYPSGSYRKIANNTVLDGSVDVSVGSNLSGAAPTSATLTAEENELINQLALASPVSSSKKSNTGVIILILLIVLGGYVLYKRRGK